MANQISLNPSVPSQVVQEVKFPKFVNNLGIIPTSYKDSMSYYECLAWLCKYLEETVISTVNQNGEAVEELQGLYVELKNYLLTAQQEYETNLTTSVDNRIDSLEDFMTNYFNNLDVQDEINNKIDALIDSGDFPEIILDHLGNKLNNYCDSNSASLGDELLTDSSLWQLNNGWTGNASSGFSHIVNETSNLVYNANFESDKFYFLEFDITSSAGTGENASCAVTVQIGNSDLPILYKGGGSDHYKIGIKPTEAGTLKFIPCSPSDQHTSSGILNGTIWNISLKEVTGSLEQLSIIDSNDDPSLSFTITPSNSNNVIIGNDSDKKSVSGFSNVFIGKNSGRDNVGGFYNIGVGYNTLTNNVQGTRNIAIGFNALRNNVSADRNIAIGSFCMNDNISARKNIAIGFDSLQHLQLGQNNLVIGNMAMGSSSATESSDNIAIGNQAMANGSIQGSFNTAIGILAEAKLTTGTSNIGIGRLSLYQLTTGSNNVAIGNTSLNSLTGGIRNTAIGVGCLSALTTGDFNVGVGSNNSTTMSAMDNSVLIGCNNTTNLDGMSHSIILGGNVTGTSQHKTLTDVVIINSGTEQVNSINDHRTIISKSLFIDTSGTRKKVGIQKETPTARLHIPGSTADSGTAPIKIDSGSLMTTPEDGAFEYANGHLYFTIGTTRNQIV